MHRLATVHARDNQPNNQPTNQPTTNDVTTQPISISLIITKTMFMVLSSWHSHCESSPGSFDKCRMAPRGRRPKTKPDHLGCESVCTGCQSLHPPSPFIIITQHKSWYSFYRPTESRRLSRPSWLVTYQDGLPVHRRSPILVLTGSDIAQLCWSRTMRYTKPNRRPKLGFNVQRAKKCTTLR